MSAEMRNLHQSLPVPSLSPRLQLLPSAGGPGTVKGHLRLEEGSLATRNSHIELGVSSSSGLVADLHEVLASWEAWTLAAV